MPLIANQVARAVESPDSSIDDIRSLIEQDSAIAARILKISNSALYGYGAIAADPEVAFTAGLMHHIGKTAIANSHRSEYERVMMTVDNEGRSFIEVEREVFGFSHAELGAAVVQQWGLPDSLVLIIRHHHEPRQARRTRRRRRAHLRVDDRDQSLPFQARRRPLPSDRRARHREPAGLVLSQSRALGRRASPEPLQRADQRESGPDGLTPRPPGEARAPPDIPC